MNTQKKIKILIIQFQNSLLLRDVSAFRGAIISKVPADLTLFHNHIGDSLRYRYPLIQYKRIRGKAAIICVGEGTEAIGSFFSQADFRLKIGKREEDFVVESIHANQWLLQTWETEFHYTLRKWLPFNGDNYNAYKQLETLTDKVEMLEHILIGNILSMCTGLGKHIESPITCKVVQIIGEQTYTFKGVKMQGFDIEFCTNLDIPDYLGLGKGVSHGFGIIKQMNKQSEK
ncbi:MAG: CRISPR-associated endonuclease Cas6 [Paludibacteraceae bacterium]